MARRNLLAGASTTTVTLLLLAASSAPGGGPAPEGTGEVPAKPSSPVTVNILDVAGNRQLTQGMIDEFKAQQDANRVDIDLVLTGVDGIAASSQTIITALYYSAAGIRAPQTTDTMAVIYTGTMLVLLVVALRFVNPTQLVARVKEETD